MIKSVFSHSLFSGLIPALLAIIFVCFGLNQTTDQLKILQEQISYSRKPVLVVNSDPNFSDVQNSEPKLTVFNVGNEPAENVFFKFHLMLVTDTSVVSIGQRNHPRSHFTDSTRSPREKLWPRLTIYPDSQEVRLDNRVFHEVVMSYFDRPNDLDARKELLDLRRQIEGIYVLFMELSYRRQSDLVLYADTIYFKFEPIWGSYNVLLEDIGGPGIQERVKSYLFNGPQVSVNIHRDRWEIFKHSANYPGVRQVDIQVIRK